MPECHKCKWNGRGNAAACLACMGPDEAHGVGHGSSRAARGHMVSLDSLAEVSGGVLDSNPVAARMMTLGDARGEGHAFGCSPEAEDAVRRALAFLAKVPDNLALLFLARVRGETATSAARRLGVTRRALNYALARLAAREPDVAAIFGRTASLPEGFDLPPAGTPEQGELGL